MDRDRREGRQDLALRRAWRARGVPSADPSPVGRWWVVALVAICALGIVRMAFWAVTQPVPTGDEVAHLAYVESLVSGDGIPVTGRDRIRPEVLQLYKDSVTYGQRSTAASPQVADGWGLSGEQYHGFQGPGFYVLQAPFYLVGRAVGGNAGIIAMRVGGIAMALGAVVATFALARTLVPRRPVVWLVAPLVLVAQGSFVTQTAVASNDSITPLLGAVTMLAAARLWIRPSLGRGVVLGATLAFAVVTKSSAIGLVPALAVVAIALLVRERRLGRGVPALGALGGAAAAAALIGVPWALWNLRVYGELSGVKANGLLAEAAIGRRSATWDEGRRLFVAGLKDLSTWEAVAGLPQARSSVTLWWVALVVASIAAPVAALVRRRYAEAAIAAMLASLVPVTLVVLIAACFYQSDGYGLVVGRHLLVVLPGVAVLLAMALAEVVGRGAIVAGVVFAVSLVAVGGSLRGLTPRWEYGEMAVDSSAPVSGATYTESLIETDAVAIEPTCPMTHVALSLQSDALPSIAGDGPLVSVGQRNGLRIYALATPHSEPTTITLAEPAPVGVAGDAEAAAMWATGTGADAGTGGVPVTGLVYCASVDAVGDTFEWAYRPEQPWPLTLGAIDAYARAEPWLAAALALVAAAAAWRAGCLRQG